jgi:hypothetical protein
VPGLLLEQVEEFLLARKQAEHAVTASSVRPAEGRLSGPSTVATMPATSTTLANGHRDVNERGLAAPNG